MSGAIFGVWDRTARLENGGDLSSLFCTGLRRSDEGRPLGRFALGCHRQSPPAALGSEVACGRRWLGRLSIHYKWSAHQRAGSSDLLQKGMKIGRNTSPELRLRLIRASAVRAHCS